MTAISQPVAEQSDGKDQSGYVSVRMVVSGVRGASEEISLPRMRALHQAIEEGIIMLEGRERQMANAGLESFIKVIERAEVLAVHLHPQRVHNADKQRPECHQCAGVRWIKCDNLTCRLAHNREGYHQCQACAGSGFAVAGR